MAKSKDEAVPEVSPVPAEGANGSPPKKLLDPELDVLNKIAKLLAKLPDDGTRARVILYLTDRYGPQYVPTEG